MPLSQRTSYDCVIYNLWWILCLISRRITSLMLSAVCIMMTSSNGNIFHVTGHLCGEFTGHRWIPCTMASGAELWCFLWSAPWVNGWVNIREAGDLRRQCAHYDFIVMIMSGGWTRSPVDQITDPRRTVLTLVFIRLEGVMTWFIQTHISAYKTIASEDGK